MSCLVPTIQLLQPSVTNPILRPKISRGKTQDSTTRPSQQRRKKSYPGDSPSSFSLPRLIPKMRLTAFRNSALFSLLGLSSAQSSQQTWAQTQPFNVDVSTESLLSSATQGLTNIVGTNTPSTAAAAVTTGLAPAVSITDAFSTTMPTELSTGGSSQGEGSGGVVNVTSSRASVESVSSGSVSGSVSARANSTAAITSATIPSEGAAAPTGVGAKGKVMGVAGVLAGAAGVLFV
jgi:hypothetical protein